MSRQDVLVTAEWAEKNLGTPGVVFLGNKEIFAKALARGKYEDLFTDRFGGTWGHTTEAGHRLIAENLAERVLALRGKNETGRFLPLAKPPPRAVAAIKHAPPRCAARSRSSAAACARRKRPRT